MTASISWFPGKSSLRHTRRLRRRSGLEVGLFSVPTPLLGDLAEAKAPPSRLGLVSETRQTIAPVTLFEGTSNQFTVELLGEWVLSVFADGAPSSVHYGRNQTSPETPVLRVLGDQGNELGALTFQQRLGDEGLEITIPGVATISVAESPRAIDGASGTEPVLEPTLALAAVDVVRIQLLGGGLADVRVGHMEAAVAVPLEGVICPGIEVTQTADPTQVKPGDEFTYTIVVTNPGTDAGAVVPPGAPVDVRIGGPGSDAGSLRIGGAVEEAGGVLSALPRTGGIALAGLALVLLGAGATLRLAGWRRPGRNTA